MAQRRPAGLNRQIAKRILTTSLDAVLSRRRQEQTADQSLAAECLREDFRSIPFGDPDATGLSLTESAWIANMNHLKHCVEQKEPDCFLRWEVIRRTMFIPLAWSIRAELGYLRSRPDWNERWKPALREVNVGAPTRYPLMLSSSGNLIHHAYHLARFEATSGVSANELRAVFEFGGGYGSMCRLFRNAGFSGRYVIYDLPPFAALQRYFLRCTGVEVHTPKELAGAVDGACCVSDRESLDVALGSIPADQAAFVATWSISETPESLRDEILPLVEGYDSYLLAYQDHFGEVDNLSFFRQWISQQPGVRWWDDRIEHLGNNRYLFGRRMNRSFCR